MDFNNNNNSGLNNLNDVNTETYDNIDVFVNQRRGRKCLTSIYGLGDDKKKLKSLCKSLRKNFNCSASIATKDDDDSEENDEKYIKMTGDHGKNVCEFLVDVLKIDKSKIKLHGI